MPSLTGYVSIVQEGRFHLVDDTGAGHLFILSPHAAVETAQLRPLAARQVRVTVTFKEVALLVGLSAERIELEAA